MTALPQDPMFVQAGNFEAELGVPQGFLERLLNDGDDWSFVIKVHALVEGALTHAITATVAREELKDFFGGLAVGDTKRGNWLSRTDCTCSTSAESPSSALSEGSAISLHTT